MIGLTSRQKELLAFIHRFVGQHGYAPTYRQMCAGIGISSTGCIYRHLTSLVERGHLFWSYGRIHAPVIIKDEPYRFIPVARAA